MKGLSYKILLKEKNIFFMITPRVLEKRFFMRFIVMVFICFGQIWASDPLQDKSSLNTTRQNIVPCATGKRKTLPVDQENPYLQYLKKAKIDLESQYKLWDSTRIEQDLSNKVTLAKKLFSQKNYHYAAIIYEWLLPLYDSEDMQPLIEKFLTRGQCYLFHARNLRLHGQISGFDQTSRSFIQDSIDKAWADAESKHDIPLMASISLEKAYGSTKDKKILEAENGFNLIKDTGTSPFLQLSFIKFICENSDTSEQSLEWSQRGIDICNRFETQNSNSRPKTKKDITKKRQVFQGIIDATPHQIPIEELSKHS